MAEDPGTTPVEDALALLGKLVSGRAAPERMMQEVGAIVAGWAGEPDVGPAEAQQRIERLWDSLSKDAADLQEQIADAEGGDVRALGDARRMLAALEAAVQALAAAHGRL